MDWIIDVEANGFLDTVTKIHCVVLKDPVTGEKHSFGPNQIEEGLHLAAQADRLIGHNLICYDIPVIRKLYAWFPDFYGKAYDTLVISRLIFSNLYDLDAVWIRKEEKKLGQKIDFTTIKNGKKKSLFGSHSLEAWGRRLGNYKGDYKGGFDDWSEEMQRYCEQDIEVTEALLQKIISKAYSETAIDIELKFQYWIHRQEIHGWQFDKKAAGNLYGQLCRDRALVEAELQEVFPPEKIPFTPKVNNAKLGYQKGVTIYREKPFNPNSDAHIRKRLVEKYCWAPTDFTDTGLAQVGAEILEKLPYPEVKPLVKYLKIQKVIERVEGWLKAEKDGVVHGRVNTLGAKTGRCTHTVIVNVPRVKKDKHTKEVLFGYAGNYGADMRSCFLVPDRADDGDEYVLVGADASGLELRCLAHYMAKFDAGEYVNIVTTGDVHTTNMLAMGLTDRDNAKIKVYAHNYGAGDANLGDGNRKRGAMLRASLMKNLPALKKLVDSVKKRVKENGFIKAIDGRLIFCLQQYMSLNYLLQSCGSIIVKVATILLCEELEKRYTYGRDWAMVGHFHDEFQIQAKRKIADEVTRLAVESFARAGEFFGFRCPITGESKIGRNWAETH